MSDLKTRYSAFRDACLASKFQKERHVPSSAGAASGSEEIYSVFAESHHKSMWYLSHPVPTPPQRESAPKEDNTEIITFKLPHTGIYHAVNDSCFKLKLPPITFSEGYEGRWCLNPANNIIQKASLSVNEVVLQTIDTVTQDFHVQTQVTVDQQAATEADIGNDPTLLNWSRVLPSYTLTVRLPWFYSGNTSTFLPLYLFRTMDRIIHEFTLRRNVRDLIQIRRINGLSSTSGTTLSEMNVEPTYELVPFSSAYVKVGTGPESQPLLPYPEFLVDMSFMTDDEAEYNRCHGLHRILTIPDTLCYESNPEVLDKTVTIPFKKVNFPVFALQWAARNENAVLRGSRSNYSTSLDSPNKGWSPIRNSTLRGNGFQFFENLESQLTERHYTARRFPRAPYHPGYNSWTFALKAGESSLTPGVDLTDGELVVKLGDGNPYPNAIAAAEAKYTLQVRLHVFKRVELSNTAATEAERTKESGLVVVTVGSG